MASPFQQQAFNRKLTYGALILALFTASLAWRKGEANLLGINVRGVDAQASALSIREESHGQVDWLGALARLSTIGTRGAATCVLWVNAMDAMKKNQWNELELYARSLTKLQPHFITPWLFQSWNLSYNVSVESDRPNDKYFYITRGIGLLAEGERQNRDNPDIRWSIGFFTEHKICKSDETNVMRSLSQLSMIPPNERDPGRFWTKREGGRQEINLTELEDFCKLHPQLVRRLREGIRRERRTEQFRQFRCERPEDLVQFLQDNFRLPSMWAAPQQSSQPGSWKQKQDTELPLADRFPVLPPNPETRPADSRPYQQPPDGTTLNDQSRLSDEHDGYHLARAWYSYAQEPLPKPGDLPGSSEPFQNRVYQRLQKGMMTVIFRMQPAQAQRFAAERLQEEGWYDSSGWDISDWFRDGFVDGKPAVVGGGDSVSSLVAWRRNRESWINFGRSNHLLVEPAEMENFERLADALAKKKHLKDRFQIPIMTEEDKNAETQKQFFAWMFLRDLVQHKNVCNFDVHYNRAQVESEEATVQARKLFFEALDATRLRNDERGALRRYLDPAGMKTWRDKVLLSNKVFRNDSMIEEYTFEVQLRFIDLYSRLGGRDFKAQSVRMLLMPVQNPLGGGVCPVGLVSWVPPLIEKNWDNPLLGGPFDGNDKEGKPILPEQARMQVLQRLFPALFSAAARQGTAPTQMPSTQQPPG